MSVDIVVRIAGEPHAQGRPRFRVIGRHVQTYDPPESAAWKEHARSYMLDAVRAAGHGAGPAYASGPLEVHVLAVFSCPVSDHRKRIPAPRRPKDTWPDADNVAKAALDAAKGVLWKDDGQVARLWVEKDVGAQGEEPFVRVLVRRLAPAGGLFGGA